VELVIFAAPGASAPPMLGYVTRKARSYAFCMVYESRVPPMPRVNMLVDAATGSVRVPGEVVQT
jgi:hypothetical protein